MQTTPCSRARRLPAAAILLALGWTAVIAEAAFEIKYAPPLYDEAGYLYEGWLVCAHGYRPYRDFHTKVTPLLYYFYGLPQALLGPSLLLGRAQAAATTLLSLALSSWAIGRRRGLWAAAALPWLFAVTIAGLDQHFRALAIAPSALWTALALLSISFSDRPSAPWAAGAAIALLLLTRHDLIGLALGLLLGLYLTAGLLAAAKATATAATVFGAALASFIAYAPRAVLRMLTLGKLFPLPPTGPHPFSRTEHLTLQNLPWYLKFLARAYFAAGATLIVAAWSRLTARRSSRSSYPVAFAALLAAVINIALRGAATALTGRNAFYLRDFYIELPLLTAAAGLATAAYAQATTPIRRRLIAATTIAAILLGPFAFGPRRVFRPSPIDLPAAVAQAGQFIAAHTAEDDRVFSIADPYIFLAAGRQLLPHLTHHMFMYAPAARTDDLRGSWCFNLDMLLQMLRKRATVVVLSERGMRWLVHNERTDAGLEVDRAIRRELARHWRKVASTTNPFVGHIEIYRPKQIDTPDV